MLLYGVSERAYAQEAPQVQSRRGLLFTSKGVYCASPTDVADVWVDRARRVADGRLVDHDLAALAGASPWPPSWSPGPVSPFSYTAAVRSSTTTDRVDCNIRALGPFGGQSRLH